MAKHYEVNNETKVINANMRILSDNDLRVLKNYVAIGYTINPIESKKQKVQIATEEEKALNPFSAMNIQKYLEEEGTKEQQDEYWKLFNARLKNNACYKKDTKDGKHKAGEPRVKGHINTLKWFKENLGKKYEESEWLKKTLAEATKKIEEKKKEEENSKK